MNTTTPLPINVKNAQVPICSSIQLLDNVWCAHTSTNSTTLLLMNASSAQQGTSILIKIPKIALNVLQANFSITTLLLANAWIANTRISTTISHQENARLVLTLLRSLIRARVSASAAATTPCLAMTPTLVSVTIMPDMISRASNV